MLTTLIPLLIILFIFMLLLYLVCLPVRCVCRVCCGAKLDEEEEDAAAANVAATEQTASNGV